MDTSMKRRNLLAAFFCILSYSSLVLATSTCNAVTYGSPLAQDCFDLLLQLPGGVTSPSIDVDALRSFVEPKFLQPEFAPVYDPFETEMVQLPKLWKKGTCCLALLSIATPSGIVQQGTSIDNWRTVQNAFIDTVQVCLVEGQGQGSGGMLLANTFYVTEAYGALIGDSLHCQKEYYGSPPVAQCGMLLAAFASSTDNQPRYFDEEQLRANGLNWPGVRNNYRTEIVQLPAYWSAGTCNIALYGDQISPHSGTISAGLSSWRNVRLAGLELLNRCLVGNVGGVIYVKSYNGISFAGSIVMWESGSYFDFMSNVMQNSPSAIRPILAELSNGNRSITGINATLGLNTTLAASVKLPWNFTSASRQ
ncbi:hypothetical protein JMJ35_000990 [Cladonia borealis]|uniref:Uncharacterized protein n=1 Tax=Cladonia borealis TaxID=184061 RepID=A0AA39V523_9LECA|nr:hypothetical protein JMJ35_000990 [Cladonia borealis]